MQKFKRASVITQIVGIMKTLNERIVDVAKNLQTLSTPRFSTEVQEAAEKRDKDALVKVCKKAKIPQVYVGTIVSTVLSVHPQKYPLTF
jgi:hypothetical protein